MGRCPLSRARVAPLGLHKTANDFIAATGIPRAVLLNTRMRDIGLVQKRHELALTLRRENASWPQIAAVMGCSHTTAMDGAKQFAKAHGEALPSNQKPRTRRSSYATPKPPPPPRPMYDDGDDA